MDLVSVTWPLTAAQEDTRGIQCNEPWDRAVVLRGNLAGGTWWAAGGGKGADADAQGDLPRQVHGLWAVRGLEATAQNHLPAKTPLPPPMPGTSADQLPLPQPHAT